MEKVLIILVKIFPKVSETFIYKEISLLCQYGYRPIIYSMWPPDGEPSLNKVDLFPDIEVRYVPPFSDDHDEMKMLMRRLKKKYSEELINRLARISTTEYATGRGKRKFICCHAAFRIIEDLGFTDPQNYHIHAQFLDYPAEIAYLIHEITGVNYSISCHARDIYTSSPEDIKKVVSNSIGLKTCTHYNAHYLKDIVDVPDIKTVYHGVDCDFFTNHHEEKPLRLLSVARFVEKKGYPYMFEALAKFMEKNSNFILTIIGHGKLEEECRKLIQSHHLEDKVVVIPYASKAIVKYYLANCDIFINASVIAHDNDRDGIPNSVAEAMSMEVPVIATDVSGISELVIHKETGYLAIPNNADSLLDGLEYFIHNPEDRKRIAQNGRSYVLDHFQSKMMFEDCLAFYSEVLNK